MTAMADGEVLIHSIADTARWVAGYRAQETARPDALFRDPYAATLAGAEGDRMMRHLPTAAGAAWAFVLRTHLFDQEILAAVEDGVDLVVNLAAGLDARPYRLPLPESLTWIEIDLPEVLERKQAILSDAKPACRVERIPLDLSNLEARRACFAALGHRGRHALVFTEGLLIYLDEAQVGELARDLAAVDSFHRWVTDLASPGLLLRVQRGFGKHLKDAGAPLKFGPAEGVEFFRPYGWRPVTVQSVFKAAAAAHRLPFFLRLIALFPEPAKAGNRPWSGVCRLVRA
jgi:methyltransferase (TIGR00027 family)